MQRTQQAWAAILAATVLTLPLGSIYAFSVFLAPIEAALAIPRSALSFIFGAATVGYIIGMNIAPLVFRLASPAFLTIASAVLAAAGIGLAAIADGFLTLLLGYSVMFGMAGGAAYSILQQYANLSTSLRVTDVDSPGYARIFPHGAATS